MTITAADVATFYDAGADHWWWLTPDGELVVSDQPWADHTPVGGATYLMPWDQAWFEQWDSDWERAATQLNAILDHIQQNQEA